MLAKKLQNDQQQSAEKVKGPRGQLKQFKQLVAESEEVKQLAEVRLFVKQYPMPGDL